MPFKYFLEISWVFSRFLPQEMRDALCLMLLGTTWLIASQILLLDPVSAWLLMQPSVLYPLFDRLFLSPSVPLSLFLGYSLGFLDYLSYSEFLVFIFSCCIKNTKTSTYLYTIDRHKKKQSICILATLPSLLKSI